MNVQFSRERPVSEVQAEREALEQEKEALQQRIVQLTEDKRNLMLAMTDMYEQNLALEEKSRNVMLAMTELYEMLLPLLPDEGGTL